MTDCGDSTLGAMKADTAISVIVRTRDRPLLLSRALRSINEQIGELPEVVVVNDGGLEEPVDLAVERTAYKGPAIRIVHQLRALGRGGAWNAGVRAATGEWLATLDDDDTWMPDFCATITAVIGSLAGQRPPIEGIVAQTIEVNERLRGGEWQKISTRQYNPRLRSIRLQDLILLNRFTNNAFVFPRQAYATIGPFREDLPVLEDWEFNVRFAARYPIRVVPKPLARYHRRKGLVSESDRNTAVQVHEETREQILEGWIRDDLAAGRFGLGALALLSEIESNRGLRLFNRMASWIGR